MPYRVDARMSGRHPFQDYMVGMSLLVGFLFTFGIVSKPPSIVEFVPTWGEITWSWVLFLSALTTIVGVYWRDRAHGLILEQLGLFVLGVAVIFFAVALFVVNGQAASLVGALIVGFGLSCLRRWHQIQQVLDQVHAIEKQNKRSRG